MYICIYMDIYIYTSGNLPHPTKPSCQGRNSSWLGGTQCVAPSEALYLGSPDDFTQLKQYVAMMSSLLTIYII